MSCHPHRRFGKIYQHYIILQHRAFEKSINHLKIAIYFQIVKIINFATNVSLKTQLWQLFPPCSIYASSSQLRSYFFHPDRQSAVILPTTPKNLLLPDTSDHCSSRGPLMTQGLDDPVERPFSVHFDFQNPGFSKSC